MVKGSEANHCYHSLDSDVGQIAAPCICDLLSDPSVMAQGAKSCFGDKDYCAANDVGFRAEQVQLTRGGGGGGEGTGGGRRESQREHNRKWSGRCCNCERL